MIRFDNGDERFWEEYARFLKVEAELTADPKQKSALLCALARIQEERLGDAKRAWALLGEAMALMPTEPDVLWEAWRNGSRRDFESKMRVLEHLSIIQDRPRDIVSCRVRMAKLRRDDIQDEVGAETELEEALWLMPEARDVLWTQAETHLGRDDPAAAVASLEHLAELSADPSWKASLYTATASMKLKCGFQRQEIEASFSKALDQPVLDWADVNETLRTCMENGSWPLVDRALRVMAEAAQRREPAPVLDRPAGWGFEGFDRGDDVSAALWWYIALVRERRLGNMEDAITALRKANELLPRHPFLGVELARLLETSGRPKEALEILPDFASTAWRAQLALSAGRPELVASILYRDEPVESSLVGGVIRDMIQDPEDEPPGEDEPVEKLEKWLMLHPNHERAYGVAYALVEKGSDWPVAALAVQEGGPADRMWPVIDKGPEPPLWSLAVEAVWFQEDESPARLAQRFVRWAEKTEDSTLSSVLYTVAGLFTEEDESGAGTALELFKKAEDSSPQAAVVGTRVLRLLRELGLWKELSSRLSVGAAETKDEQHALELLYQQSIVEEHGVGDRHAAARLYEELSFRDPTDLFALLALARLSFADLDYDGTAEKLVRLAELCPEESSRFRLLAGELNLFALDNETKALEHFDLAAQSADEILAQTARLYRLYVLFQLGNTDALDQALQEEALLAPTEQESLWIAEVLETGRAARGTSTVAELLEHGSEDTPVRRLWAAMVGQQSHGSPMVTEALACLGHRAPVGAMSGACKTAADILDAAHSAQSLSSSPFESEDMQSEEALCRLAEKAGETMEPGRRAELLLQRSRLAAKYDEWEALDWILEAAEAYEEAGQLHRALQLVGEALHRSPEHPGLLEAHARIAYAHESFAEAGETRMRLARFFEVPEERAAQMAIAAKISLDHLADEEGAERLSREALDLYPGHAGAHDVLVRVYKGRGDDASVAELIGERISVEHKPDELVELYKEQADQLLSLDDTEGALAALDKLLELDPGCLDGHHSRMELLTALDRWEDALEATEGYVSAATDLEDIRPVCWRASEVVRFRLGDADAAYRWLARLVDQGDRHPETQRRMCDLALCLERFDDAAAGFERLADLVEDPERRNAVRVQQAKVLLELLFDDERAGSVIDDVLSSAPDNLDALLLARTFRSPADLSRDLVRAKGALRVKLAGGEEPMTQLENLHEVAELSGEVGLERFCGDALAAMRGQRFERFAADPAGILEEASGELHRLVAHPDLIHPASNIASIARVAAAEVFAKPDHLPVFGKNTLVGRKASDPIKGWLAGWAEALEIDEFELHRVDLGDAGCAKLPRGKAAVAVTPGVVPPLSNAQRFEMLRELWLSHVGLGGFAEGDVSGPVRWVLAITAAVLGEDSNLPAPTDRALVQKAKKALSRKMRKALEEPCSQLLASSSQSLRNWAAAGEMTADRYGLLAAPSLFEVFEAVAIRSAASHGREQFAQNPTETILGLPRCRDLLSFAVSQEHMDARRLLGITDLGANGVRNE